MSGRRSQEIIKEILDITDRNFSLYMNMIDYAEEVFFDDSAYCRAQKLCIAIKSDMYRSLRIIGVSHDETLATLQRAIENKTSILAELKSAISF